jgi:hypothetical protein
VRCCSAFWAARYARIMREPVEESIALLRPALATVRKSGGNAGLLQPCAAADLAQLWRDARSNSGPRALLEPILATIEGGETSRDVRNARALLVELV